MSWELQHLTTGPAATVPSTVFMAKFDYLLRRAKCSGTALRISRWMPQPSSQDNLGPLMETVTTAQFYILHDLIGYIYLQAAQVKVYYYREDDGLPVDVWMD